MAVLVKSEFVAMNVNREEAERLAARDYTVIVSEDATTEDETMFVWVARTPELRGCLAQGDTEDEARENLRLVRIDHIEHLLDHDLAVPEPGAISTL